MKFTISEINDYFFKIFLDLDLAKFIAIGKP